MDWTAIIAAIGGAFAGGGGKAIFDHMRASSGDANQFSKVLIDDLRSRVLQLEKDHGDCQKRETETAKKVGVLEERCADQERQIASLHASMKNLEAKVALPKGE